jgi:uncharacterized protein (DUF58 family)
MPTGRGWGLLGAGLALTACWWILGDPELFVVAAFLVAAVLIALVYVHFASTRVSIGRQLPSSPVHSGETTSITLLARASGRTVRSLRLADNVHGLGRATFQVARIRPEEQVTASYRVTCRPRGIYRVGPTTGSVTDPLGLAEIGIRKGPVDRLVVYPYVEELRFPIIRGSRAPVDARRPEHVHRGGEDFDTLREFQQGDDLRRIHWPSTARTDQLMIRQLDAPWQSRAMVILDTRSNVYESADAFETAVSGTASIVTYLISTGHATDLWTTESELTDATHYSAAMELLAAVEPEEDLDIAAAATQLRGRGGGGALVIVTGSADRELLSVNTLLASDYSQTLLMMVSTSTPQAIVGYQRLGAVTVQVPPGSAWSHALQSSVRTSWETASAR